MGRRVKKDIQTVKVGTDNPHLKRLQQMAIDRAKSASNGDFVKMSESEVRLMHQMVELREKLDKLNPRGRYIRDIASGACVAIDDVERMAWGMTDEELEQAARDANNIYREIETELNFDSKLSREQIEILLPVMNDFVFAEAQSVNDVLRLLDCSLVNPVRVKNNRTLAFFLSQLSGMNLVCSNWAQVAELSKSFISSKGTEIKASNLTTSLARYLVQEDERTKEIKDWIISVVERCKG